MTVSDLSALILGRLPEWTAGLVLVSLIITMALSLLVLRMRRRIEDMGRLVQENFDRTAGLLEAAEKQTQKELYQSLGFMQDTLVKRISDHFSLQKQLLDGFETALSQFRMEMYARQEQFADRVSASLSAQQKENTRQLEHIRHTVDEKLHDTLEKRLGASFQLVSKQLDQVSRGLGEMQTLAGGVGDLKKVLSNVKTRGMLGEYQLGAILSEILTPRQYVENARTRKGSRDHVEFAVVLPGEKDRPLLLPMDSKFPLASYEALLSAIDVGETAAVQQARQVLARAVAGFAKEIADKYIDPPHTTDFGVMFLPVEGLYAEVVRDVALVEMLQRRMQIIVTGPTTLAAFLNALQMGFRTLAIQKRSSQVWQVLSSIKTEFGKFAVQLDKVEKHFNTARSSLTELKTTRSRVLGRKLDQVDRLDVDTALDREPDSPQ